MRGAVGLDSNREIRVNLTQKSSKFGCPFASVTVNLLDANQTFLDMRDGKFEIVQAFPEAVLRRLVRVRGVQSLDVISLVLNQAVISEGAGQFSQNSHRFCIQMYDLKCQNSKPNVEHPTASSWQANL
jgi:hypothetical protein